MLKAWLISFFVLLLLAAAIYLGIFDWLATGSARLVGLGAIGIALIAAFLVLGNPLRKGK